MIGLLAGLTVRFDVVAIGAMTGLGYAVLAAGLVLVYRSSRIINLAHGQIGAFSAIMLVELHHWGVPYAIALPLAILIGAAIGVIVERTLVEPLSRRSVLAVLVATIGVTQVLLVARDASGHPVPNPPVLWDIESDPVLAGTKLIAEAWDAAGLYQVGSFIGDSWKEWNGRFRDDARAFFRGERIAKKRQKE